MMPVKTWIFWLEHSDMRKVFAQAGKYFLLRLTRDAFAGVE